MRQEDRQVTGRGDYILSTDRDNFFNVRVREARIYIDHRMVLAAIRGKGALQKRRYVVGRVRWPLENSTVRPHTEGRAAFAPLKGEVKRNQHPKAARLEWISKETCHLADRRSALQRAGRASTREVCKAQSDFQRALQEDRVQAVGSNIEGFLETCRVKEV